MILSVHLLAGAALASKIQIAPLALLLAFLSHYFLDFFPHDEYSIKRIKKRNWSKSFFDFLKIGADLLFGLVVIFTLAKSKEFIIYLAAFFAVLPDLFTFLEIVFPGKTRFLVWHGRLHKKIHLPPEDKNKFSPFLRAFFQLIIVCFIVFLLVF